MIAAFIFVAGQCVGMLSLYFVVVRPLIRSHVVAYDYAAERSDSKYAAGRAYLDMATVLMLYLDKDGCEKVRNRRSV